MFGKKPDNENIYIRIVDGSKSFEARCRYTDFFDKIIDMAKKFLASTDSSKKS